MVHPDGGKREEGLPLTAVLHEIQVGLGLGQRGDGMRRHDRNAVVSAVITGRSGVTDHLIRGGGHRVTRCTRYRGGQRAWRGSRERTRLLWRTYGYVFAGIGGSVATV